MIKPKFRIVLEQVSESALGDIAADQALDDCVQIRAEVEEIAELCRLSESLKEPDVKLYLSS